MIPSHRVPTHPGEVLQEEFLGPLRLTQVKLAEHIGVHRLHRGAALGAPQLAHPLQIVRFDCREKLRDCLIRRLRGRLFRPAPFATSCQSGEQDALNCKSSLHDVRPVVGTTRR